MGSFNKYELDKKTGMLKLDRVLYRRYIIRQIMDLTPDVSRRRRSVRCARCRYLAGSPANIGRSACDRTYDRNGAKIKNVWEV
jgi:hypothetical protein